MACTELNYGTYQVVRNTPRPLTEEEQEKQWLDRRARAYTARDKAAKSITYFEQAPDDLCVVQLANAHQDHGMYSAEIIRLDYEGRKRGWLKATIIDDPAYPVAVNKMSEDALKAAEDAWRNPAKGIQPYRDNY